MSEANIIKAQEAANLCQLAVAYYLMNKKTKGDAVIEMAKRKLAELRP